MMSYGIRMMTVDGKAFRSAGVIFACIAMFISSTHLPFEYLSTDKTKMEQFGGGGSLEEQCGSITFEDIFIYNQAVFEVRVNDDWQTAEVDARAWINWSLALITLVIGPLIAVLFLAFWQIFSNEFNPDTRIEAAPDETSAGE